MTIIIAIIIIIIIATRIIIIITYIMGEGRAASSGFAVITMACRGEPR